MGNIYFKQKNYPKAIKFYRMSLDQVPNSHKEMRYVYTYSFTYWKEFVWFELCFYGPLNRDQVILSKVVCLTVSGQA